MSRTDHRSHRHIHSQQLLKCCQPKKELKGKRGNRDWNSQVHHQPHMDWSLQKTHYPSPLKLRSLRRYLDDYLTIRGPVGPKDFLFMYMGGKTKGQPVRGDRVYLEFKRYAKVAGIPSTRSLHGMRHQAVTQWIDDGFYTMEARLLAGHSS